LKEDEGKREQQPWHETNQTLGDRKPARNAFQEIGRKNAQKRKVNDANRQEAIAGQAQGIKDHPSGERNSG
jgi:hypothetical protein